MQEKLVIWGASSHALVVADIIRTAGAYEIVGFLDDLNLERRNQEFCGAQVLGGREQLDRLIHRGVRHLIIGIGNNRARLRLSAIARTEGYQLTIAIHPRATVATGVLVGPGTVIMAGAVVNPGARLGENVIINTAATVEHECTIGDGAMINTGARVGGKVEVGYAATIEIGAIVGTRVRIGAGAVVGAGALVLHDIPAGMLAYGAPARVVREVVAHG